MTREWGTPDTLSHTKCILQRNAVQIFFSLHHNNLMVFELHYLHFTHYYVTKIRSNLLKETILTDEFTDEMSAAIFSKKLPLL